MTKKQVSNTLTDIRVEIGILASAISAMMDVIIKSNPVLATHDAFDTDHFRINRQAVLAVKNAFLRSNNSMPYLKRAAAARFAGELGDTTEEQAQKLREMLFDSPEFRTWFTSNF